MIIKHISTGANSGEYSVYKTLWNSKQVLSRTTLMYWTIIQDYCSL